MSRRARFRTVLRVLAVGLVGGTVAAFSALGNLEGSEATQPVRIDLVDRILCVFAPDGAPAGFYREMRSAEARMHRATEEAARTGDPDRDFARLMIPHHQGAIEMALIQLKYGRDQRLRRLAQSIIVEQGQEIAYLRTILDGSAAPGTTARVDGIR